MLDRLDRIEALGRRSAGPETLLAELRELVREAEAWARREGTPASGTATAKAAACPYAHRAEGGSTRS